MGGGFAVAYASPAVEMKAVLRFDGGLGEEARDLVAVVAIAKVGSIELKLYAHLIPAELISK